MKTSERGEIMFQEIFGSRIPNVAKIVNKKQCTPQISLTIIVKLSFKSGNKTIPFSVAKQL